jgi:hypothetical protein
VRHPARPEAVIEAPAKLDTAADVTGIPEMLAEHLQLEPVGEIVLTGFDRENRSVKLCWVVIALPTGRQGRVKAAVVSTDYVLLGRDILNHLRLLLDGPPSPSKF